MLEAFDWQLSVETQESEIAFLDSVLLPAERSQKIMDDKSYEETTDLQMLFGNKLLYGPGKKLRDVGDESTR